MHLMPIYLAAYSRLSDNEKLKKFDIMSCIECGNCSYICPANVPIVQYIKTSKNLILAANKEASIENAAKERKL
jgi:electron transport complex protein RnfC